MNSDDALDVVAAGMYSNVVCWYEAPLWAKHIIDSNLSGAISVYVADIDSNNEFDVVAAWYYSNQVVLYQPPSWNKCVIDSNLVGARKVCIADLDGDGTLDIVATGMNQGIVCWYEAPSWTKHIIDSQLYGAYFVEVADMDGDNDLDVIATGTTADDVVWYENNIVVGVENKSTIVPAEYSLYQNYPNPFNPSTTIEYHIQELSLVTIKVYNVLGKEVATLINEYKPAGKYETEFNAANLPSGIYFYKVQAGDFVETKKMILMK